MQIQTLRAILKNIYQIMMQRIIKQQFKLDQLIKIDIIIMRVQRTQKAKYIQQLDNELASNQLIRKNLVDGRLSLFRAVSDRLLHNQNEGQKLFEFCILYFEKCIKQKTLPKKLQHFIQNPSLFEDYKNYPDMNGFSKVHLELISQYYQTRIEVFYLTDDMYLNSTIIDNNYKRTIHLCKINYHYDPVYTKQHLDLYNIIKDFIYEKIKLSSEQTGGSHQDDYVLERRPSQIHKRKHKKSLSACDQNQYKQLQFSLLNNCLEPPNRVQSQFNGVIHHVENEFDFLKPTVQTLERKGSLDKFQFFSPSKDEDFPSIDYMPMNGYNLYMQEYRTIQSQRFIQYQQQQPLNNGNTNKRYQGRLKFFDENKNYGFIIMDQDNSEIFVHFDDLSKAGITKEYLRNTKHGYILRFEFGCMFYLGKYKNSRKAVDLVMLHGYMTQMF